MTISFVICRSVLLSYRTTCFQLYAIHYIVQLFRNLCNNIDIFKIRCINDTCHLCDTFHEDRCTVHFTTMSTCLRPVMSSVSGQVIDEIRTYILTSFLPRISRLLYDNVEKISTAIQATDGSIIRPMRCDCRTPVIRINIHTPKV